MLEGHRREVKEGVGERSTETLGVRETEGKALMEGGGVPWGDSEGRAEKEGVKTADGVDIGENDKGGVGLKEGNFTEGEGSEEAEPGCGEALVQTVTDTETLKEGEKLE